MICRNIPATITPKQLHELVQKRDAVDLIHVRTPAEFREVHVEFAKNISRERLDPAHVAASHGTSGKPLYVICLSGGRSSQASTKLAAAGVPQVVNVEGAGFPG